MNELREREFPSLAKEGCREAAGWFDQEINYWTNTTPALRATPPLLRRGISLVCLFIHTFYDRACSGYPQTGYFFSLKPAGIETSASVTEVETETSS